MKKKTLARLSTLCFAAAAASVAVMSTSANAADGNTVKIGFVTDMSGLYADSKRFAWRSRTSAAR
jgi:branched-chain amino acid transport system substrate-binding protein